MGPEAPKGSKATACALVETGRAITASAGDASHGNADETGTAANSEGSAKGLNDGEGDAADETAVSHSAPVPTSTARPLDAAPCGAGGDVGLPNASKSANGAGAPAAAAAGAAVDQSPNASKTATGAAAAGGAANPEPAARASKGSKAAAGPPAPDCVLWTSLPPKASKTGRVSGSD